MEKEQFQEQVIVSITALNAAIKNLRLYPENSPITIAVTKNAWLSVLDSINFIGHLNFTVVEGNLLIFDDAVNTERQDKMAVREFIELMNLKKIQSISFFKGLEEIEFKNFLETFSEKFEEANSGDGFKKCIETKNFRHVQFEFKNYEDQKLNISSSSKKNDNIDLTKVFPVMVQILDNLLEGENKRSVAETLASSLVKKDANFLGQLLTLKMGGEFGADLFERLIEALDEQTLEKILLRLLQRMKVSATQDDALEVPETLSYRQTIKKIISTEKGGRVQHGLELKRAEEKAEREKKIEELRAGISLIIKGDRGVFKNKQVMQSIPSMLLHMIAKKDEAVWSIIEGLGIGLISDDQEIRDASSKVLLMVTKKMSVENCLEIFDSICGPLTQWLKIEKVISSDYEYICNQLVELACNYIQNERFADCRFIWETFKSLQGDIHKDEKARSIASGAVNLIESEGNIIQLVNSIQSSDKEKYEQASLFLVQLGVTAVELLLDILEQSEDRSARVRILRVMTDIGQAAIPAVADRLHENKPWYFLRNLAKLLGAIGDESCLYLLRSLLLSKEYRVQKEALNSIFDIGGHRRAEIFLSVLMVVDTRLKIDIVGVLVGLKWDMAESVLLEMIESKAIDISKAGSELLEKVCSILGSIGTMKSMKVLNSIAEQNRSLIGKKPNNEKVRIAVENALNKIKNREGN